ncbi:ATP-grasp domain-containing protein [Pedobacter sp.]|uniref:ATP-grasp domain-containing protein n=1 Tax=Pedobacter sp. TaxID=1411316 RepID=UPI003BAD276F
MKIAYITYSGALKYGTANNFNENEDLLPFLQSKGLDIVAEVWDDPKVDWKHYDVALLKTPWDYHEKFEQFNIWLNKLESLGLRLLNEYQIVRWNMDKHYLAEVAAAGFDIIPSIFIEKGWNNDLTLFFEQLGSDQLIIKPCISGGSKNTLILNRAGAIEDKAQVVALVAEDDFILQPLMPQIQEGEWSFIFFNGTYSHTILKKPKEGDFRVQQIFGGTIEVASPAPEYVKIATSLASTFAQNTLYARVDGLMVDGKFLLMELELIEPFLYLSYDSQAVERYYQALVEQISTAVDLKG